MFHTIHPNQTSYDFAITQAMLIVRVAKANGNWCERRRGITDYNGMTKGTRGRWRQTLRESEPEPRQTKQAAAAPSSSFYRRPCIITTNMISSDSDRVIDRSIDQVQIEWKINNIHTYSSEIEGFGRISTISIESEWKPNLIHLLLFVRICTDTSVCSRLQTSPSFDGEIWYDMMMIFNQTRASQSDSFIYFKYI